MGSRREEERNEKIIRGLMKLPPNRRCINCNSIGPQYVCTTFWTFVCMACSGIHREFTHRVKSVSMAKFTSQEVEALQNGGNQRAREIYLKNWDSQRQRLPDNSNVDKVREFIKNVYVEKKYAGAKASDRPPTDSETHNSSEDAMRRASSYHSYSQSPPQDYQYEVRRYGKQASGFTSKPGSEQGLCGKASSFVYSPGRFSDHVFEDSFANEGSGSRASDFSVSSGGDPFRSATHSPNFQKESGFTSPPFQHSKVPSNENLQHQTTNLFPDGQPQRNTSFGSVRSFDSNSLSINSYNSGSFVDAVSESKQTMVTHQNKTSTHPLSSTSGGLDLFNTPVALEGADSNKASSIDLFQLPEAPAAPSENTSQPSTVTQAPPLNSYQPPKTYQSPSIDLFSGIVDQQPNTKQSGFSVPKNEGWATFESSQPVAQPFVEVMMSAGMPAVSNFSVSFEGKRVNTNMTWPAYQSSVVDQASSSIPTPWHEDLSGVSASTVVPSNLFWNAFDDSIKDIPLEGIKQFSESSIAATNPLSTADQHLGSRVPEDPENDDILRAAALGGPTGFDFPANSFSIPSNTPSMVLEETWPHANEHISSNPFDLPYDSELEANDMFMDMSSLHPSLPDFQPPSTCLSDLPQQWFPQDPLASYIPGPTASQGSLGYMAGQIPTSQLQNVAAQGHVASVGGNPFA